MPSTHRGPLVAQCVDGSQWQRRKNASVATGAAQGTSGLFMSTFEKKRVMKPFRAHETRGDMDASQPATSDMSGLKSRGSGTYRGLESVNSSP